MESHYFLRPETKRMRRRETKSRDNFKNGRRFHRRSYANSLPCLNEEPSILSFICQYILVMTRGKKTSSERDLNPWKTRKKDIGKIKNGREERENWETVDITLSLFPHTTSLEYLTQDERNERSKIRKQTLTSRRNKRKVDNEKANKLFAIYLDWQRHWTELLNIYRNKDGYR